MRRISKCVRTYLGSFPVTRQGTTPRRARAPRTSNDIGRGGEGGERENGGSVGARVGLRRYLINVLKMGLVSVAKLNTGAVLRIVSRIKASVNGFPSTGRFTTCLNFIPEGGVAKKIVVSSTASEAGDETTRTFGGIVPSVSENSSTFTTFCRQVSTGTKAKGTVATAYEGLTVTFCGAVLLKRSCIRRNGGHCHRELTSGRGTLLRGLTGGRGVGLSRIT